MSYLFFINDLMLPIPPPSMTVKINNKNKVISLINEGEVNVIKTAGLIEVSFDARLPNHEYPFASYDSSLSDNLMDAVSSRLLGNSFSFKKADYFLEKFKVRKKTKAPFRLIITRMLPSFSMLFDTNLLVTLEDYQVKEDYKEGFDIVVPLKFKQYKPYGTKTCTAKKDKDGSITLTVNQPRPAIDKVTSSVYRVRNEETLWQIAQGISGGSVSVRDLMIKNGIFNPLAKKGQVLRF